MQAIVDPEIKAEFEEMQKNNKGVTAGASNLQNLDLANDFASWMAGTKKPVPVEEDNEDNEDKKESKKETKKETRKETKREEKKGKR
jgi:hypothetical protein